MSRRKKGNKSFPPGRAARHSGSPSKSVTTVAVCCGLAALIWLAFGQVIHNDFVNYDDGDYVYENPNVTGGVTLQSIGWAFTHVHAANWHPVTTISHMLDCQIYGLQPWGHHLTNVLLHALATILLFFALLKLTGRDDSPSRPSNAQHSTLNSQLSTLNICASAFVAALFAIHPLRVESVAWISERKDVLSGVFFMLTLLAYARYAQSERFSIGWYLSVLVLFALGLMCKPTLVTLPFILLLLDYWPLSRMRSAKGEELSGKSEGERSVVRGPWSVVHDRCSVVRGQSSVVPLPWSVVRGRWSVVSGLLVEKIPLSLLSAVSCVVTVLAQKEAIESHLHLTVLERLANAITSYVAYLRELFYPVSLSVSYPYGIVGSFAVVWASLLLLAISVMFFVFRKRYPFLLTGWLWYLGMLVPMIGFVQVGLQPRADRYTYLPQIGLYILVTWGAALLLVRLNWGRFVSVILSSLIILALIATTRAQTRYWRNSETLWRRATESTADNYIARNDLGTLLLRQRQPERAIVEFQKAEQIKPDFENAYVGAGSALMLMGDVDGAIDSYQKALHLRANAAEDWSNLATALLRKGENGEAIEDYKKAVSLKPESAEMQYNLGHAFAMSGSWVDAIPCYQAAIRLRPSEAKFYNNIGVALAGIGKMDEALEQVRQAIRVNPNYPEAHYNLGSLLAHVGQKQEAAAELREALRIKPDYPDAAKRLRELGVSP